MKYVFVLVTALAASGLAALGYTNSIENGESYTITNAWDAAGDMVVGNTTSNNSLFVVDGGSLTNENGYVGWQAGASNNVASVSGSGSEWINNGTLTVGAAGNSNNTVLVSDGGTVTAGNLVIDAASDFNLNDGGTLVITDAFDADQSGFHWTNGATLTVQGELTYNNDLTGTNQTLNLDGGSWDRGGDLVVDGAGNTLEILNGGAVTNDDGAVGGSNNTVLVSGDGSEWINNGMLAIGNADSNTANSVTVQDGGRVQADSLSIGVDDAFNLNDGGTLAMTGDFDFSAQPNLDWNSGGTLSVGGALSGITNLASGRALTLDGAGASWGSVTEDMILSGDASLLLKNGAMVSNANLSVYSDAAVTVESDAWMLVGDAATTNGLADGGIMVASTNGASIAVNSGGSLTAEEPLRVGNSASETGTVTVADGGTITAGALEIADTNSVFYLNDGGTLAITGDAFDAAMDGFEWLDGGTLSVGGDLTGLDELAGTNRTLRIDDGTWDLMPSNLYITGVGNTLSIENGGQVTNASAYIGVTSNDYDNAVFVGGTGSVWTVSEDLFVNSSNTLELATGGLVSVAGNMSVSNATVAGTGTVELGGAGSMLHVMGSHSQLSTNVLFDGQGGSAAFTESELVVAGTLTNRFVNFGRLSMTNSTLSGYGVVDGIANINMSGGWIAPEGALVIASSFEATNTTLQVTAGTDSLQVTDAAGLDLSGMSAEVMINNNIIPNGYDQEILTADNGLNGTTFASTNFTEHFLLYDFLLTNDATTVSVVSEAALDGEIGSASAYAGVQGVRAGFNGMQNAVFVRTKQLRRNAVATDNAVGQRAAEFKANQTPEGPQGPGDDNTIFGMHFWMEQFSGQGDYDAIGGSDGFDLNNNGTTFGFDRLFGDSLVAGINYTYARSDANTTGGDKAETETYWLGLYGEWVSPDEFYIDGLLALGWSDYTTVRTDTGYTGQGKFSGSDFGGHLEGGKYFHRGNWAMAPYAGLHYLWIKSDAYTETEQQSGNEVTVSGQEVASLESALGVKLRNRFDTRVGRFQTAGYAEWAYDFINDDIDSTISDGEVSVTTARITPGASLFNAGIGLSWICTDYLEVGVGYDGRFNEDYEEHLGSIMLDVRF